MSNLDKFRTAKKKLYINTSGRLFDVYLLESVPSNDHVELLDVIQHSYDKPNTLELGLQSFEIAMNRFIREGEEYFFNFEKDAKSRITKYELISNNYILVLQLKYK